MQLITLKKGTSVDPELIRSITALPNIPDDPKLGARVSVSYDGKQCLIEGFPDDEAAIAFAEELRTGVNTMVVLRNQSARQEREQGRLRRIMDARPEAGSPIPIHVGDALPG